MTDDRLSGKVEIFDRRIAYSGFFDLRIYDFRYRRYDGSWSRRHDREVFERGPTAAILLFDPARESVVLVEQFRAPMVDDPDGPWIVEAAAGIVEPGEAVADVVRREALEETGLTVDRVIELFDVIPSPGGSTERISLFIGLVDARNAGGVHGLDSEDEDIRTIVMPLSAALSAIGKSIVSAPAIIGLQWLALNRDDIVGEGRDERD
jgi:ADP-ribose pyrophosphatase